MEIHTINQIGRRHSSGDTVVYDARTHQRSIIHKTKTGRTVTSNESNGKVITNNRKKGNTPNKKWPPLPPNLGGKNPKWNSNGYWDGANGGRYTWDNRSHRAGIDRGNGAQDGHWDDEKSGNRWDRNGALLFQKSHSFADQISDMTGLYGPALAAYLIISEVSRIVIPPRNLIPVP